jgi:hypothetical protein
MASLAPLLSVTITSFLVIVLARAVWHKVDRFLETVGFAQGYGLVPDAWAALIVRALTVAETAAIVALMVPSWRGAGGLFAAGLFAGYGAIMAAALARGRDRIDCGCGGLPQIVSAFTLGRNAVLTGMALSVAILPAVALPRPEVAVAIAGALVLAAIYAIIERLASHLPYIRQGDI